MSNILDTVSIKMKRKTGFNGFLNVGITRFFKKNQLGFQNIFFFLQTLHRSLTVLQKSHLGYF